MKILFINPSLRLEAPNKYLPVGLGAVMTYVDRMGDYQIELLDIDINAYDDDTVEKLICESDHDVFLSGSIVTHYKWMKWLTRIIRKHHPTKKIIIGMNNIETYFTDLLEILAISSNLPLLLSSANEGNKSLMIESHIKRKTMLNLKGTV